VKQLDLFPPAPVVRSPRTTGGDAAAKRELGRVLRGALRTSKIVGDTGLTRREIARLLRPLPPITVPWG
jgi:hypothetical protein